MLNLKHHADLCYQIIAEVSAALTASGHPGAIAVLRELLHEDVALQSKLPSKTVQFVSLARRSAALIEARCGISAMADTLEAFIVADGMDEETAESLTLFYLTRVKDQKRLVRLVMHLPFPELRRRRAELVGRSLHQQGQHAEAERVWGILGEAEGATTRLNCYRRLLDLGHVRLALGVAAFIPTGPCHLPELLAERAGRHALAALAFSEGWCEVAEVALPSGIDS